MADVRVMYILVIPRYGAENKHQFPTGGIEMEKLPGC
jgi:hypothetical protein